METKPENSTEKQEEREYSFEEGVKEVLKRITEILENQKFAAIAFNSTGANVGKTELAMRLMNELTKNENVFAVCSHGLEKKEVERMQETVARFAKEKIVIILDELSMDGTQYKDLLYLVNRIISKALADTGWNIKKIDLWVGLCRQKELAPVADVIIRNKFAKDK